MVAKGTRSEAYGKTTAHTRTGECACWACCKWVNSNGLTKQGRQDELYLLNMGLMKMLWVYMELFGIGEKNEEVAVRECACYRSSTSSGLVINDVNGVNGIVASLSTNCNC